MLAIMLELVFRLGTGLPLVSAQPLSACGTQKLHIEMINVPESWPEHAINRDHLYLWNQYMDIYRYGKTSPSWGKNDKNEFGGYPSNADLHTKWGFDWNGALAMTCIWRSWWPPWENCREIKETDIVFNPAYTWTLDRDDAEDNPTNVIFYDSVLLHELGHSWGMLSFLEYYRYPAPTVMHAYQRYVVQDSMLIHASDAIALRDAYASQEAVPTIINMGIHSKYADTGHQVWTNATTDKTAYAPGESFTINNLTIENTGTVDLNNVHVRAYLSTDRNNITNANAIIGDWSWNVFPNESYGVYSFTGSIPPGMAAGSYYVLAVVTYDGYNDDGWWDNVTHLWQKISLSSPSQYTLTVGTNPSGGGSINLNPAGGSYPSGTQVTLTARANSGYAFSSWSGVDSSNGTTATVTMNSNRTVTAIFKASISFSPTSQNHGPGAEAGSFNVIAPSGYSWTAFTETSWIKITSGSKGTGNGTVSYSVSANPGPGSRTGQVIVDSKGFIITQAAPPSSCTYSLSPTSRNHGPGTDILESGEVYVATGAGCAWTAKSNASWIAIVSCVMDPDGNKASDYSGGSTGSGYVCYRLSPNPGPNSRTGTITIAGKTFKVTQAAPTTSCVYTLSVNIFPQTYVPPPPGTVTRTPQKNYYCAGNQVTLTATPSSGWNFSHWSGDSSGSVNPITITMNSNKSVAANFVLQSSACTYTLSSTSQSFAAAGGTGSIGVTAGAGCGWTAASNASWITIPSSTSGSGNGTVNYSVSSNSGSGSRTGTLTIAGQIFTVIQGVVSSSWTSVNPPAVSPDWSLTRMHSASAGDGWVAGYDNANKRGVLLRHSGSSWTSVAAPPVSSDWDLEGIHFTSADEGWAVGSDSVNDRGVLLHRSGGAWTYVSPPSVSSLWYLCGVHFTSSNEGWAIGGDTANTRGSLLHYSGGTWIPVTPPFVSSNWYLRGIHFTSSSEGWAVGANKANGNGVLLHYSGGAWTSVTPPPVSPNWWLLGVHFASPGEGWAVGHDETNGRGVLLHYSGGAWTLASPPSSSGHWWVRGVYFTSSSEGWAVGGNSTSNRGVILRYSGDAWTSLTPPAVSSHWELLGVHSTSPSEAWAVGVDDIYKKGVLLHFNSSPADVARGILDTELTMTGSASSVTVEKAFTIQAPEIDSVEPSSGSVNEVITVNGFFFGTTQGKVTLGGKACRVLSWAMDPKTGESEIQFVMPKGFAMGAHELQVTNGVGFDGVGFTVD